jgi:UDP:flavonoid glycosyltransferase YjiC (YdhE family)
MSRILVVATTGAGGDFQPLAAAALALRDRGHELVVLGDLSVQRNAAAPGVTTELIPPDSNSVRRSEARSETRRRRPMAILLQPDRSYRSG